MNPYIIIGVMVVIDLITLPIIIKKILKKDGKNKGIKIAVLIAAFVIVEAVCSFFCIESNVFYDREGNQYKSAESIVYYDREGVSYTLRETGMARKHFVSTDGRIMRIAERAYVDKDGYLVFDLKNEGPNSPSVALSPQSAITLPSLQNERIQDRMCIVEVGQTVPRTVAMALSNAMITLLGDLMQANRHMNSTTHLIQGWQDGAIVYMGKVVNKEIANRYGLRYVDISLLTQLS